MRYRNIKTGAEIEVRSIISAPDWIMVESDQHREEPTEAPPSPKKTAAKRPATTNKGAKK